MIVYFHLNPKTFEIFYVGIGSEKRARQKDNRNKHWNHYVSKHGNPIIQIVQGSLSKQLACYWEKFYISLLGKRINGGQLVNLSDGGETNIGTRYNDEHKKRCSEAAKKRGTAHLQTKEIRAKASISISTALMGKRIGEKNPNYGNKWTDKMKMDMSTKKKEYFSKIPSRKKIYQKLPPHIAKQNSFNGMIEAWGKKVVCSKTGVVFKTIVDAANSIGMKKDTLRQKLNGRNSNNTYFKFV